MPVHPRLRGNISFFKAKIKAWTFCEWLQSKIYGQVFSYLALAKIKMMTSLSHLTADKLSPSDVQKLAVSSQTENIFPCLSVTLFLSQIVLPIRMCLSSSLFNYFNRHPKSWDVRNSVSGLSLKVLLLRFQNLALWMASPSFWLLGWKLWNPNWPLPFSNIHF